VVAVAVGITIGRTVRLRDRQVGEEPATPDVPAPEIPLQKSEEPRRG
jgi:hypothetical protein